MRPCHGSSKLPLKPGNAPTTKAAVVKVLGAAGLSFSLANSASASTMPTFGIPQSDNTSPNPRFVLSEEEMVDVSLATFYVFDRENVGSGVQLARGCGGGCGGGGGCRGGGGCGPASVVAAVAGVLAAEVARGGCRAGAAAAAVAVGFFFGGCFRVRGLRWLRGWRGLLRILGSVPLVLGPTKAPL